MLPPWTTIDGAYCAAYDDGCVLLVLHEAWGWTGYLIRGQFNIEIEIRGGKHATEADRLKAILRQAAAGEPVASNSRYKTGRFGHIRRRMLEARGGEDKMHPSCRPPRAYRG